MELLGLRQPFVQFQEEKYQMLELNQRLESYLGRVKLLEEENKVLREEIHTLKSSRETAGKRRAQEEALVQARRMKEEAWRKKDGVEMELENLMEDIEKVSIQRQKAKSAQVEAQRKLSESKKELEEERRAQIWLREKVGQLEKDLLLQMQVHQENMESLQASLKQTKQVLMAPQFTQTSSVSDLGQEYSNRAAQAWQEATSNYQRQVGRLEESLNQAKAHMAKIHQEKRESQQQVQHLAKELESTKMKRQMLEKNMVQQRDEQKQDIHHLQAQIDALELEKDSLGQQMDSLMMDRQNLLQVKMSLGLEVATYRALLDGEGLRIDRPANKTNTLFTLDALSKSTGIHPHPSLQTTAASSHVSSSVSTSHRSITSSRSLLTSASPAWTPTRGTPQRPTTRAIVPENTEAHISEETEKAAEESVDHLQQEKIYEDAALESTLAKATAEPEPELKPQDIEVQVEPNHFQKAQMVESETEESVLISEPANQPSSLTQTPEIESWAGPFTDPAGVSEEGKDEDTEVSIEMARISHAPKVAWEENKTMAEDEKDDASEMDVKSEIISESHTVGGNDDDDDILKIQSQTTKILASSFLEQETFDLMGDFGNTEETNEDFDEQDNVSNISEEVTEQMNSETEVVIDSIDEWDRQEENEPENEMKVTSPDSEEEEEAEMTIDTDMKDKTEDEDETEKEEEIEVIERDISVQDDVDSPKNKDHQEILEEMVPPAEPHPDLTANEDHHLPEEPEGEEENQGDEDDSPNISASCRTDPGECDSYSQENTLADTRPLIHYKSDEETDRNIPASRLNEETSDNEDEKKRMDQGNWNESASKRFNTMEDLTEEPDMDVTGEMMMEEVVSKVEALDEDRESMMLQNGSESLGAVEKESELKENLEEYGDVDVKEMRGDEEHDEKVHEQNEHQQLIVNQHLHTEQSEDETVHSYENQDASIDHTSSFPEASEQEKFESSFESQSTLTMFHNAATIKEPEDLLDVSMHTNIDPMASPRHVQSDMPNSDQEDCNSSEDESPNASQCFQNTSLLATAALDEKPLTFTNGVSEADSVSNKQEAPEGEKSTEEPKASQIDDWENFNVWGERASVSETAEITHAGMDDNSAVFPVNETENLESSDKMSSVQENIFGNFEKHLEKSEESFSEKVVTVMDFESNDPEVKEEFQTKENKSEIHSFFSNTLKEDFWGVGKMEMAATYDSAKTEDLNQTMVFEEEWTDMEGTPKANGNSKEKMGLINGKEGKHTEDQPTQGKVVLSDDEGDSWSSGDE